VEWYSAQQAHSQVPTVGRMEAGGHYWRHLLA